MNGDHRLRRQAGEAPEDPGVYLFRDAAGKILYIGKAKSLRSRVRSYFQAGAGQTPRIRRMLAAARDLQVLVTRTEVEALVLENQLIKRERPRFNVLLRDDKTYPYLRLTWPDRFPRAVLVRRAALDGHLYFGPYLPASTARRTLKTLARLFQVATCYEKLDGSRARPCLYYHMNQCLAPCAGLVGEEEYRAAVHDARMFLEGRSRELRLALEEKMRRAAAREDYEEAGRYRDLVRLIDRQPARAGLAGVGLADQDFISCFRENGRAVLLVFALRNGEVRSRREFRFEDLDLPDADFLSAALGQYYGASDDVPALVSVDREVADAGWICRWLSEKSGRRVRVAVPRRGPRRRFLETLNRNARLAFEAAFQAVSHGAAALESLREYLDLDDPPFRIEAFDISHTGGRQTVASVVVWEGGRALRSAFRRLRLRAPDGPDDYRSMAEAVGRRCSRLIREGKPLPDLILLDGGRGQLGAAREAFRRHDIPPVPLAAIAKSEELVYLPDRADPLPIPRNSPVLHLIQRIRDEAHRFAHRYHEQLRTRQMLQSELTEVAGIGPARARRLLRRFGSLRGLRAASRDELRREVGETLADRIRSHFGDPAS